jgi:DTW domain-containing protein YfiP
MHGTLCICPLIPELETRTRLMLLLHRLEARKPTNTGRLAADCLVNSEIIERGHEHAPTSALDFGGRLPLLLYPFEDARPLEGFVASETPVCLIVPDGTWRQAAKARNRVPGLKDVTCVSLPKGRPTQYRLRRETQDEGLATMEAIMRAMGVLEGPEVEAAMERVFLAMVERTLWLRGAIPTEEVTGGVPEAALARDPRGALSRST